MSLIWLTQKPHDIGMVKLFHAGSFSKKIFHLWAGTDGDYKQKQWTGELTIINNTHIQNTVGVHMT